MARSLLSLIFLNFILAVMFVILFSSGVSSTTVCQGRCIEFRDCAMLCQSLGYTTTHCSGICCCSK
ncbi:hypothetical protein VIGAN_11092300 [Vigna angularis var. angularis]|uniref:Knottin scorpion toxin-like domain-containing protein n=1 Tax=Vigna angularis var. angularis TaxID=157739 RepID=A0A0S3T9P3_PHAAN|nr:hypothetical protein VIGAN_11092300 [Vigna angularis var. angularis]